MEKVVLHRCPLTFLKGEWHGCHAVQKALDQAHQVILNDRGEAEGAEGTYVEQFKNVYGVDLAKLASGEAIDEKEDGSVRGRVGP